MSYNIITDPDDLLRIEIPRNVMRDIKRVMERIEDLLPSIYRGLRRVLDMVRPWSFEQAIYHDELNAIKEILRLLDNPEISYLIGVPFQPIEIVGNEAILTMNMGIPKSQISVLGPTKCTVLIYPVTIMYPNIVLRSVLVHELVHCTIVDPHERVTYRVEKMLANFAPDLFLAARYPPPHIMRASIEYIKRNRVPVVDFKTNNVVTKKIRTDPEYARQILSKSVIVQLRPSASWKKKS